MRRHEYLNFSPRHNFKVLWSYNSLCIYNTYYTHIETLHFDLRRTSLANQFGMHLVYRRRSPHTHPQFAHFGSGCLFTLLCSLDKHDADIYMTNTLYEIYLSISSSLYLLLNRKVKARGADKHEPQTTRLYTPTTTTTTSTTTTAKLYPIALRWNLNDDDNATKHLNRIN